MDKVAPESIAFAYDVMQNCLMKSVSVRDFTSRFATLSHQPLQVHKRRKVVGTWTPALKAPPPLDVMKRVREDFERPLPFTGAEIIREGRRK